MILFCWELLSLSVMLDWFFELGFFLLAFWLLLLFWWFLGFFLYSQERFHFLFFINGYVLLSQFMTRAWWHLWWLWRVSFASWESVHERKVVLGSHKSHSKVMSKDCWRWMSFWGTKAPKVCNLQKSPPVLLSKDLIITQWGMVGGGQLQCYKGY